MPSIAQEADRLRAGTAAGSPVTGLPGLVRRAVGLGAEILDTLGRAMSGCAINDRVEDLDRRLTAAEDALAAECRLTAGRHEDSIQRLDDAVSLISEFYVGPPHAGVKWEGSE